MKNTTQNTQKQPYSSPTITDVGSVVERTLGQKDGEQLDATFPVNTPKSQLTFS